MPLKLIVENYRCFRDKISIDIESGIHGFIGKNNSGKSTILKLFYELRFTFNAIIDNINKGHFQNSFTIASGVLPDIIEDKNEIFNNESDPDETINIYIENKITDHTIPIQFKISLSRNLESKFSIQYGTRVLSSVSSILNAGHPREYKIIFNTKHINVDRKNDIGTIEFNGHEWENTLNEIRYLCNTIYIGPFRNAVNLIHDSSRTKDENYFDIQIGQSFIEKWKSIKNGPIKTQNEKARKITEDIRRILEFKNLEINPSANNKTLQLFINDKSYRLAELGSGIAQLILVLINIAIKEPAYALIDEPELSLHPSLQIDFINAIDSYCKCGIFFTTHSIGLLKSISDSAYVLNKTDEKVFFKKIEIEKDINLIEKIGELNFSGYRYLGFNKILLVEGITDVKTIQSLLRFYNNNHSILILPMGGSQLVTNSEQAQNQFNELKKLNASIFVLIDSEKNKHSKKIDEVRIKFKQLCQELGFDCHILEKRAIENYFPQKAINSLGRNFKAALDEYDKPAFPKNLNWKIASAMNKDDIEGTDLGDFLQKLTT